MVHDAQWFTDGAGYERLMVRWTRAAGANFLVWLAPASGARWLDVGCGTGAFTELVADMWSPASVIAVDPSPAQIELARTKPVTQRVDFRVADAQTLPFSLTLVLAAARFRRTFRSCRAQPPPFL